MPTDNDGYLSKNIGVLRADYGSIPRLTKIR